jgi:outer membrane immunogenic protein
MKTCNKIAGAALLLISAATTGKTADLPARDTYRAAPVVVGYNWSGFYFGVMGGYAFGTGDINKFSGGVAGATLGANWQAAGSPLVLGVEVDGGWTNFGDSISATAFGVTATAESKAQALATFRARAGYAIDRTLLYVTGGGAWLRNELSLSVVAPGLAVGASDSQNHFGYAVGGGIEQAFAGNWSVKVEYNYMGFGSKTYFDFIESGDVNMHLVKAGLNYRF